MGDGGERVRLVASRPPAAVPLDRYEQPELTVLVNFGLLAGREPSPAEIEKLAQRLLAEVERATIKREQRFDIGERLNAYLHEVVIEIPDDAASGPHRLVLQQRVIEAASEWVEECIADPGDPHNLAERLARQAVVDLQGDGDAAL
jgi:hypothetical protein